VPEKQEHDADGDLEAVVARLQAELGGQAIDVPAAPPPAPPPTRLGLVRTRLSVATWRLRGALPESVKSPLRRVLRRPAPATLAQPSEPSDVTTAIEGLQIEQVELARRLSELEERLAAVEQRGRRRAETSPPAQ
jgi:hypothetical protein